MRADRFVVWLVFVCDSWGGSGWGGIVCCVCFESWSSRSVKSNGSFIESLKSVLMCLNSVVLYLSLMASISWMMVFSLLSALYSSGSRKSSFCRLVLVVVVDMLISSSNKA